MIDPFKTALLAILLALTGCAGDKAYRPDLTACEMSGSAAQCARNAILIHPGQTDGYRLGFVEFDDQGQVRDRGQLDAVLKYFESIAGKEDVLLVTFAHGWHHNAGPDDDNVRNFSRLLGQLAEAESESGHRQVLGLYIGWRGESVNVPLLNYATFWDRKNTAHKVGANGVTEVLLRLEQIVNVKEGIAADDVRKNHGSEQCGKNIPKNEADDGKPESKPNQSRMAVIGHSFGGAVLFTALQQILEDRFIDSRRGKTWSDTAKGFGDLVVLVNPAFEALRYASLHDLTRERCSYFPQQLPKLAILTSEADWATGYSFPAGRFFSTLFESHNTLDRSYCSPTGTETLQLREGQADRNTVGHFAPFLTHELHATGEGARHLTDDGLSSCDLKRRWASQQAGGEFDFGDSRLVHLGHAHPLNPHLNIRVDSALIAGHNEIWDPRVVNFIRDLIAISTAPEPASQPECEKDGEGEK